MKIAGPDIGTTGCKLTVFNENGERLGKAYREYAVRRDMSGHEIDAAAVTDSVYAVIREMAEQTTAAVRATAAVKRTTITQTAIQTRRIP